MNWFKNIKSNNDYDKIIMKEYIIKPKQLQHQVFPSGSSASVLTEPFLAYLRGSDEAWRFQGCMVVTEISHSM